MITSLGEETAGLHASHVFVRLVLCVVFCFFFCCFFFGGGVFSSCESLVGLRLVISARSGLFI